MSFLTSQKDIYSSAKVHTLKRRLVESREQYNEAPK